MGGYAVKNTAKNRSAGFTLYEALVGLGLAGLAALAVTKAVSLMNHSGASMLTGTNTIIAQQKANAAITRALENLNRSRLPLGPIILDGAEISLKKHPLANLKGTSAPRIDSDVLSIIEVSPLHRGTVTETSFANGTISITACGFVQLPLSTEFRSFIAVGSAGVFQLVGSMRQIAPACGLLEGISISGLLQNTAPSPQGFITVWGVLREYSLFVDRSSQFRIASHVGQRILENQPITRGIRALSLTLATATNTRFVKVAVSATGVKPLTTLAAPLFVQREIWEELWG